MADTTPVVPDLKAAAASDPTQTPTVKRKGVQINPAVPEPVPAPVPPEPFLAEGTAREIEIYGQAIDPRTGLVLTADDLPAGRRS